MKFSYYILGAAAIILAGCVDAQSTSTADGFISQLPEAIIAAVPPSQDLRYIKIDPIDGCYVYRHVGPVETTFLPLRTANGNPICSRAQDETA